MNPTPIQSAGPTFLCDLQREMDVTRRVLERVRAEDFAWQPHSKSMTLGRLAMHVATLLEWTRDTQRNDVLDLSTAAPSRLEPTDAADLLRTFDEGAGAVRQAMAGVTDESLQKIWTLRQGEQILFTKPRGYVLRVWCINHLIHHRAQVCVYLRMLNIPVPAVYFNSADEPEWTFA